MPGTRTAARDSAAGSARSQPPAPRSNPRSSTWSSPPAAWRSAVRQTDLAQVGALRDRPADGIDSLVADDQVQVGAVRAEGIVARSAQLLASLPPTMLPADHVAPQAVIEAGARPHAALRRLDAHPIPEADATLRRRLRMQLHLRV